MELFIHIGKGYSECNTQKIRYGERNSENESTERREKTGTQGQTMEKSSNDNLPVRYVGDCLFVFLHFINAI